MQSHTSCIYLAFLHCGFSNVSSNGLPERMHNHIGCIFLAFLHCAFSNVPSKCLPHRMQSHIGCICGTFSNMDFQMILQGTCVKRSHWLHLFDFSPLCVFKCVLKCSLREEAKSHWLHLFNFSAFFFRIFTFASFKPKS